MNSIFRYFATLLITASFVFSLTACGPTLKRLENLADELRIHNKSIARVTNEFHAVGKLSDTFHKGVLTANDKFSKSLDGADAAIVAAKQVTSKTEAKGALDYARRIIDSNAFPAFLDISDAIFDIPPELKTRINELLALMKIAFAAITTFFASAGMPLKSEDLIYAE